MARSAAAISSWSDGCCAAAPSETNIISAMALRLLRTLALLLFLLLLHLRAVLQIAQRLEGAGDDLLSLGEALHDLDVALAGEPRRHRRELHRALVVDVDALFVLRLGRLRRARLLADDERLD